MFLLPNIAGFPRFGNYWENKDSLPKFMATVAQACTRILERSSRAAALPRERADGGAFFLNLKRSVPSIFLSLTVAHPVFSWQLRWRPTARRVTTQDWPRCRRMASEGVGRRRRPRPTPRGEGGGQVWSARFLGIDSISIHGTTIEENEWTATRLSLLRGSFFFSSRPVFQERRPFVKSPVPVVSSK